MDEQCHLKETHEHQLVSDASKQTPNSPDNRPLGLVTSNDEELDDESITNDPLSACDSGSEGEYGDNTWHDHPSLENEPDLPPLDQNVPIVEPDSALVPEAPNILSKEATTTEGASPARG